MKTIPKYDALVYCDQTKVLTRNKVVITYDCEDPAMYLNKLGIKVHAYTYVDDKLVLLIKI